MTYQREETLKPNTVIVGGVEIDTPDVTPDRALREAWRLDGGVIEIDWALARQQFRETAQMERSAFCVALLDEGILSPAEAKEAARGEWPNAFASFLVGLNAAIADRLEIEWATATSIRRSHLMIDALAEAHWSELTQEYAAKKADDLFGYTGQ